METNFPAKDHTGVTLSISLAEFDIMSICATASGISVGSLKLRNRMLTQIALCFVAEITVRLRHENSHVFQIDFSEASIGEVIEAAAVFGASTITELAGELAPIITAITKAANEEIDFRNGKKNQTGAAGESDAPKETRLQ